MSQKKLVKKKAQKFFQFTNISSFFSQKYAVTIKKWPAWIQISLLFFLLSNLVYFPVYFQYFQQDEWFFMAYFHQFPFTPIGAWGALTAAFSDPEPFAFHLTPIGTFLWWFEFKLFGITFLLYALLSLVLHAIISYLVYGFVRRITRNIFVAFIAGIFFALTFSHSQAVTWMSAHLPTEMAVLFALLSINCFLDFLSFKRKKQYYLSILFFLLSVLTKETGVFLIFLLPILSIVYKSFKSLKNLKIFYAAAVGYLAFRIVMPPIIVAMTHSKTAAGIAANNTDILFSAYYTITYFIKIFSETFFSLNFLKQFSIMITDFGYPQYTANKDIGGLDYLVFTQSAGNDIALYLTGFIVIILALITYFHFSSVKLYRKAFFISFLLIVFSILPLSILAGWLLSMMSYVSSIESRHLYTTNIGMSVIFGFFMYWIYQSTTKKFLWIISLKYFFVIPLAIWVILQGIGIFYDPYVSTQASKDRKALIQSWLEDIPYLDKKTIFYSESNVALYGFAEYMLPLQNNPAQVLAGMYGVRQQLPDAYYSKTFLTKPLTGEWYEEHDGVGLGYFLTKKHLFQVVREHKVEKDDVIGVKYDGQTHQMVSMTPEIRAQLYYYLNDLAMKKDWKRYTNKAINYTFLYPPDYQVREVASENNNVLSTIEVNDSQFFKPFFKITVYKKPEQLGVSDFVAEQDNGNGELIGLNYSFEGLLVGPTKESLTAVTVKNDYNDLYFFNTATNTEVKQITIFKPQTEEEEKLVKGIVWSLEFNN